MSAIPEITVDATTGATIAVASSNDRQEVLMRCRGSARVNLGFNEPALAGAGIWINPGDGIVIAYPLCQANIYMVTAGGTSYVGVEAVF